jgi:hypothetical protein
VPPAAGAEIRGGALVVDLAGLARPVHLDRAAAAERAVDRRQGLRPPGVAHE